MKALWLTTVLLLTCAISVAQQTEKGSSSSLGATPQSTGSNEQTVQGCLQHSGGTFILNSRGVQYRLIGGDENQLKGLTGHTVAVNGEKSGSEITLHSAQDVSSTCESNTGTTNSTGSSAPAEDNKVPSKDNPNRPPLSEQPPVDTPPHSQTPPIGPTSMQSTGTLPQGSSELPLIGAVGFGMLAAGMWRRSRQPDLLERLGPIMLSAMNTRGWRVPRWLRNLLLLDLFKGMTVTFRSQHPEEIYTEQYPLERPQIAERFRGAPRLNVNPDTNETLCISCDLCAQACPENLIVVRSERNPQTRRKELTTFTYDLSRCMFCGLCEDACPVDALELTQDYEMANYSRNETVLDREALEKGTPPKRFER